MRNKRLTEEQKDKWLSEESRPDDEIYVNPLPWGSDHVTRMFDNYIQEKKTPQAKRQMKKRCTGLALERIMPISTPDWAVIVIHVCMTL